MIGSQTKALPPHKPPLLIRVVRKFRRLVFDRAYRDVIWLHRFRPKGVFQPFNDTEPDRYPEVFSFVQSKLGRNGDFNILSFGCSTGDEVFSLRQYFPRAFIKGIDIGQGNIAVCRQRLRQQHDAKISFEVCDSVRAETEAAYDAIFCMAVLRHGDLRAGVERCDHLIRFQDFASTIDDLRRCLKPGGLLIIRYSNFRLCDAPAAAAFETILRVPVRQPRKLPLFGPDNRFMLGVNYPDTVFRKLR